MIKNKIFKILSILLMYPDQQLKDNAENISIIIRDDNDILKKDELSSFLIYLKETNLSLLQENYVSLFDRQKKNFHCIYLNIFMAILENVAMQ